VVDLLERLQPYHDRNGLLWLQDLDNADKHEAIVVINHRFQVKPVRLRDQRGERSLHKTDGEPGPIDLQDGDPVFTLAHDGRLNAVHLRVEVQNTFALQADLRREWPADRLDWVVRECFHVVEHCLNEVAHHVGGDVAG
jgi:hypothetical protein